MVARATYLPAMGLALLGGACAPVSSGDLNFSRAGFDYLGSETRLLDDDIVQFRVKMIGANRIADVTEYAECVAAQYTLIRGYGFARHVSTTVSEETDYWQADAFYTVSDALPRGRRQIDAEVVVAACNENEVPTV